MKKEEEDCPVYTWKKYKKHCYIYNQKGRKFPFYKALKEKKKV